MKLIVRPSSLVFVPVLLSQLAAADPAETKSAQKQQPLVPKFVVYASEKDKELGSSLFRVLRGNDKVERFAKAETIEMATESEADVLVLVMTQRDLPKLEAKTLEALKKRKIVGIGSGAAQLFGKMGLDINLGACAHFGNVPPTIVITKSELLGVPKSADPISVLQDAAEDETQYDNFAMFLPPRGADASVVDVLARWSTKPNYAPIVRQGNCIMIGVPFPATRWTQPYANLVQDACKALHARKAQVNAAARREPTKPGTYEFKLAKRGSVEDPFRKTFYFQFSEGTKFTARMEHAGSNSVTLLFMGQDEQRMHWTRQDAGNGETLEITALISREEIQNLADRYWVLEVTNFGTDSPVDCKLTITCEEP